MDEWQAFYYFEPWGTAVEDDRWSAFLTMFYRANCDAKSAKRDIKWFDRDWQETARINAELNKKKSMDEEIFAFFDALAKPADQ